MRKLSIIPPPIFNFVGRNITKLTCKFYISENKPKMTIYTNLSHIYRVFLKGLYKILGGIVDMKINIIK